MQDPEKRGTQANVFRLSGPLQPRCRHLRLGLVADENGTCEIGTILGQNRPLGIPDHVAGDSMLSIA